MKILGRICETVKREDIFGNDPLYFDPTLQNLSLMMATGVLLSAIITLLVIPAVCFLLKKSKARCRRMMRDSWPGGRSGRSYNG